MPFETQKKNSAVDKSSSIKENDKNEIDLVSKKVIKTKQEIENLKLELQKLINTGLCSENENLTKTDVKQVEKLSCNGQEPPPNNTHCDINKRNHEKYATVGRENILLKYNKSANLPKIHQVSSNITTRFNYVSLKKYKASNNENNKIDCQKKKNEYNKEKAREYIKKQREKRAEQMKVKIKETQNEIDLRKKKLKELHEKSLQLVSKSVKQKRRKSQSYEKKVTASENKQPSTCQNKLICNLLPRVPNICELEEPKHNFNKEDREVSVDQFGYISKRKENEVTQLNSHLESHCKTDTGLLESNVKRDELLCNAATKIQAYFRGFRQRKLYRNILTIQQNENLKEENVIQSNENNLEKSKLTWLDVPATLPYPYNFINAVKKKLSHAVNKKVNERMDFSEFSKSNVLSDHFATKRNTENLTSKPAPIVENSQKHYELFNDEFNSINHVEVVPSIFKEIQLSESSITFWKNKDISFAQPFDLHVNFSQNSINRSNSSNSRCDLKSLVSNKCMDLDLQTIKPLSLKPLQIDSQYVNNNIKREYASDSDTSKNIPDISTESSVHTRICKQAHLLHSLDSSHKTDDYNLVCNPERHNNLRRSRRRKLTKSDETIQTLLSHADTDDKCLKHKKDEIVNELTANSTISKPCSSLPLSEGESKPLPLTNMIYKNDSSATNNAGETEDTGNTTMLSSFLSYMQCLGVETYTKPNTKNEVDSEKNENTTVSLLNSKCKETKLMNLNEDQFERFSEIDKRKYSSDFESLSADNLNFVPSLKCPSITLNTSHLSLHNAKDQIAHLQVPLNQKFQPKTIDTKINSNEIHLKFEAEIRLLHHFNKSLQEAVEKEKSLLENHYVPNNKNGEDEVVKEKNSNNVVSSKTKSNARIGTINYSRGSDVLNSCEPIFTASTTSDMLEKSFFSNTNLSISSVTDINESDKSYNSNSTILNFNKHHKDHLYPGLPLGMFNQLIKDEDARIENLKTILKIREKSLLDRTKSELAWLEIQKRYLKDSGQLNEISMIKKKQRGLLVKLQHERHEMQRLKQMQKAASKERKTRLRQQRSMIKAQLSTTSETVNKLKSSLSRERRHSSGPLKVVGVYRYSESIMSETSRFPKKGLGMSDNDIISLSSRSSQSIASSLLTDEIVTSQNSDFSSDSNPKEQEFRRKQNDHLKRSLLMRETALQKRRKIAEELLQWHQQLVEEERQIAELESAANSIISRVAATNPYFSLQNESSSPNFTFKGCQLNVMWQNMTGRQEQRFKDNELYIMSNEAIQQFCKDAKKSNKANVSRNTSNSDNNLKVDNNNILTEIGDENEFNSILISSASLTKSEDIAEKIIERSYTIEQVENIPNKTPKSLKVNQTSYSEDFEETSLNTYADIATKIQSKIELECVPRQNVDICCKNDSTTNNELKTVISDISVSIQTENIDNIPSDNFVSTKGLFSCNESVSDLENECLETNIEANVDTESVPVETTPFEILDNTIEKDKCGFKHISTSTINSNPSSCEEEINGAYSEEASNNSVDRLSIIVGYNKELKKLKASVASSIPDVINKVSDSEPQNTVSDALSSLQSELVTASEIVEVSKITEMPDILYKIGGYEETNKSPTISEVIFKDEKRDLSASKVDFSLAIADDIQSEHSLEFNKDLSAGQFESSSISTDTEKNEEYSIPKEVELLSKNEVKHLRNVSTKDNITSKEAEIKKENVYSLDTIEKKDGNDLEKENCNYKNVRKRIFEILTDANVSRSEPNSELQNLRINTYNTSSLSGVSPESEIVLFDKQILPKHTFASEEEEELVKKQLAIEQEIKQIEQQQKEHLPYLYLREIPNKPPPPYMPPVLTATIPSILPSSAEQVNLIVHHISNYLFNAHLNGTLPHVSLLPEIKRQMQSQIEPSCQRFIFDLCKELTVEYYKQFEEESGPSWMQITKKPKLVFQKAFDERILEKFLMKKVKESLGYEKIDRKESMIIKWSRKKRDHVDELLVLESQNEESEWTNYDKDELIVINELTNEIINSLIGETAHTLKAILAKRITSPN